MPGIFRNIPSVNQLLESPRLKQMVESVNHQVVVDGVRGFIDDMKTRISEAGQEIEIPSATEMADRIADWIAGNDRPPLRPVINGTGIMLHTGLGRAPLSGAAIAAIHQISAQYASVEINLESGKRSQRGDAVERLLCEMTGAEAAAVVNNNAAATMLALSAIASGREVVVSRGHLIEIGGSYRLPDVMECSGCKLREVGTTNRTRGSDYSGVIGETTGALLKVHPSNFEVVGFTQSVSIEELVSIGREHGVPVIDDVGSGALVDFAQFGLRGEPVVRHSIESGADIALFSGDKLLGGPQCGIIVGKRQWIGKILANPMMRAMRVDKITLAALAATLRLYRNPQEAQQQIPLLRMLSMPVENMKIRAEKTATQIQGRPGVGSCEVVESTSMLGGGSLPTQEMPSYCVALTASEWSVTSLAKRLRSDIDPVMGRISQDQVMIDMRTVFPDQDMRLVQTLERVFGTTEGDRHDGDDPDEDGSTTE